MIIFRDQYLKSLGDDAIDRSFRFLGIIETWGELSEEVKIYDYLIKPFDKGRDFNNIEAPQRLLVDVNIALGKEDKSWNYSLFLNDISAILALVTGRLIRPSESFCCETEGEFRISPSEKRSYRAHPNLTVPVQNESLQDNINDLTKSLINIRSEDDVHKHLVIIKVLRLYKDSLCLLPIDEDAAYVLLVAAGETLGAQFSQIDPTFDDIQGSDKLRDLVAEYRLDEAFLNKLSAIMLRPTHLKLKAKFVDVIKTYLHPDFFENLDKAYMPVGTYDQQSNRINIREWQAKDANFVGEASQLEQYLKNIYDRRSAFVHSGDEWPYFAKVGFGVLPGIKLDKYGNPLKQKDGTYQKEKQIQPYFWFERVINNVIQEVIREFGK
jgi:hypothetical protein